MTMPEILLLKIPTSRIRPNPHQPRRVITQSAIDAMEASLREIGQQTPAKVRPLTEAERLDDPDHDYELIGGHIRHAGALKAGLETLDCLVLNLTPEQAELAGLVDNQSTDMHWLDWVLAIERLYNAQTKKSQDKLGAQLGFSGARINYALKVAKALTPASRQLIVNSVNDLGPENAVTEFPVRTLANLLTPEEIEKALPVFLNRQMNVTQAKNYAGWVKDGNPPEAFGTIKPKTSHPVTHPAHHSGNSQPEKTDSATPKATPVTSPTEPESQPEEKADSSMESAHPSHAPQPGVSAQAPSWLWKWMVDIKFISQMRSKVKKGETLTTTEKMLVAGYKAWQFFAPARKEMWKLFKEMVKGFCESVKKALGKTAKSILDFVLPLIFIGLLIWAILAFFHFAVVSPLHWIENKIGSVFHHGDTAPEPTPVPAPVSAPPPVVPPTSISKGLGQPKHAPPLSGTGQLVASVSKPPVERQALSVPISHKKEIGASAQVYQPAVSFAPPASPAQTFSPQKPPGISSPAGTQYDLVTFETEIAAIPRNSIVKDYPLTPDETMPGDLAASRLQDLTNADKYTMKIGGDTQKIASVSSSNNTLMITFKSSDVFGNLVNGSNQPTFFWEDVNTVHINEINSSSPHSGTQPPDIIYQCSLIVSGSKIPLTIQCARPEDLEHLVSTLEYFIRHSRLGHDAQPAGLPYPTQGLRFAGSENAVNLLWANSPADKAGLRLGDRLWSVGKVANEPQGKDIFEKSLQTLPATLFVVSPADWDNALVAKNNGSSKFFSPKLRKVILSAS